MLVYEELTGELLGAAVEVHTSLGPGLLESAYEEYLCHEPLLHDLRFKRQVELPVSYKGVELSCGYGLDVVVENTVVLELKAVERHLPIHEAQLFTYLRLSRRRVGLLNNLPLTTLKKGIVRRVV